jgi:hypothetical protein
VRLIVQDADKTIATGKGLVGRIKPVHPDDADTVD